MKLIKLIFATTLLCGTQVTLAETCPLPSQITAVAQQDTVKYSADKWAASIKFDGKQSPVPSPRLFLRAGAKADTSDPSIGLVYMCAYKFADGSTLTLKPLGDASRVKLDSLQLPWTGNASLKACGGSYEDDKKNVHNAATVEECSFQPIPSTMAAS